VYLKLLLACSSNLLLIISLFFLTAYQLQANQLFF
jgi:hypothetical protein